MHFNIINRRAKEDSLSSKRVRLPTGYGSAYLSPSTLRSFDTTDRHDVLTREQPFQNFASQLDLRCDAAMEDVLRNIHNVSLDHLNQTVNKFVNSQN